ncbi:MAG TPA: helix-turn-helix transcriptional regulator [Thermomicrobiaceae bacterium]|nr:helix-turn-helix transcriptional regulator [Thermomicrobiaceae bacterium]
MKHRDYVAEREAQDPAFREARETHRAAFAFQLALVRARLDAGLTQQQLAARLGTTQSAVARWENGDVIPRLDTLQRLADVLDTAFTIAPHRGLLVGASR